MPAWRRGNECNRLGKPCELMTRELPALGCDTLSGRLYLYFECLRVGVAGFTALAAERTSLGSLVGSFANVRAAKLSVESLKIRRLLFHEEEPMRYCRSENIGIEQHYYPDDGTESHRVPRHKAENDSLVADLFSGSGGDCDGLRVYHFPHHASGTVGRAHEDGIDAQLLGGYSLQTTEQGIRGGVAAGERDAEPPQERAEEWIQPSGARERQT